MTGSGWNNVFVKYIVKLFLCILAFLFFPAAPNALADDSAGMTYEKTGDRIIELISEESALPGYTPIGVTYYSKKEVIDFASYFYERYYLGDIPVKICYTSYSDRPGEYELSVYTEKPQEAANQQRAVERRLEEVASSLNGQSDYDKAMEIYRWVYSHFEYDYSQKSLSVYSAIQTGKAVCNGYTRLFQSLCAKKGLVCEVVLGEDHAWNRVLIDGEWRYVDITWNRNISEDRWLFMREDEMKKYHKPSEV